MSQRASLRALFVVWLLLSLVSVGGSVPSAQAAAPRVAVGEVRARGALVQFEAALRLALTEEIAQLGAGRLEPGRPMVVSASLVRLSSEQRAQTFKASAAISLALRRADDQVVFAELLGHASAEEAAGSFLSVRKTALRAAVRSAVSRLPEVAARSR